MRIPRIFSAQPLSGLRDIELGEAASRHLVKVLRLGTGHPLTLFDDRGGEYSASLATTGKRVRACIDTFQEGDRQSPLELSLAIGISRGERFDWVVQKATELGATVLQPLLTERCEVKLTGERLQKKRTHWRQIAISACEQCGRNLLPDIAEPVKLAHYLQSLAQDTTPAAKLVLHHRTRLDLHHWQAEHEKPDSALLLVGPEGGLSQAEIATALACDFIPLRLGPRVMRTETAPIAALSILQYLWGDL
ncbi:16S rRNA (uracil(1498)-N(3))-methyltransferase [Microbulbifer sp. 2205BS26-8]|uniref:16S rRNA (uracil(1498)-N(3))-methyltransferase n=1 Tax=Microbulbifer sp. 2205BS26-8 TaxID=3064386 RepID=UPI00273EA3BE|nr:16S rRNA (uracil(1498)-N(3))-methyltransferase [Microbulbifer sp. 2205BS26-8]MDP5210346.1 16S rRNA (uracil(1498)-N(3))-methyltransferase [Microbulbifer sp. 2205BS26-8]